jgi:hypothetical protein
MVGSGHFGPLAQSCAALVRFNLRRTMTKLHPTYREALLAQVQRGFNRKDGEYQHFLDEARERLPEKKNEPRFEFVIRRIWFAYSCELPKGWQTVLQARYDKFVAEYEWTKTGQSSALDPALVERTLSVWQRHWPLPLKAAHVAAMLLNVRRLADVAGGIA